MYEQKQIFIKGEMLGNNVVINRYFELIYNISPLIIKNFINIINETPFLSKPVRIKKYNFVHNNCIRIHFKNKFSSGEVQLSYVLNKNNELFNDMYKILITEGENEGYFNVKQNSTVKLKNNIVIHKNENCLPKDNFVDILDNEQDESNPELIKENQIKQENIELIEASNKILNENDNIFSNEIIKPNIIFEKQSTITDFVEKNKKIPFEHLVSVSDIIKEIMPVYNENTNDDSQEIDFSEKEIKITPSEIFITQKVEKEKITRQICETAEFSHNNIADIQTYEIEEPQKEIFIANQEYINSIVENKKTSEYQINNDIHQNTNAINNIMNNIGCAENVSCSSEIDLNTNTEIQNTSEFNYANKKNNTESNRYLEKGTNYENEFEESQENYSIKKDNNYNSEQTQENSYDFDLEGLFDTATMRLNNSTKNNLNEVDDEKKEEDCQEEKTIQNEAIEDIQALSIEEENISVEASESKTFICRKNKKIGELKREEKIAMYQNILKGFDSKMVENKLNKLKDDCNLTQKEEKLTLDDVLDAQVELLIDDCSKAFRVLDGDTKQDFIQIDNELYLSKDKIYTWGDVYLLDYSSENINL